MKQFTLREVFPRMPKARKRHRCRLCGTFIEPEEERCRWVTWDDAPATSHAHPECYQKTIDYKWDEGDWESSFPGDIEPPQRNQDHGSPKIPTQRD